MNLYKVKELKGLKDMRLFNNRIGFHSFKYKYSDVSTFEIGLCLIYNQEIGYYPRYITEYRFHVVLFYTRYTFSMECKKRKLK